MVLFLSPGGRCARAGDCVRTWARSLINRGAMRRANRTLADGRPCAPPTKTHQGCAALSRSAPPPRHIWRYLEISYPCTAPSCRPWRWGSAPVLVPAASGSCISDANSRPKASSWLLKDVSHLCATKMSRSQTTTTLPRSVQNTARPGAAQGRGGKEKGVALGRATQRLLRWR